MNTKEKFQNVTSMMFQLEGRLLDIHQFDSDKSNLADAIHDEATSMFIAKWLKHMDADLAEIESSWTGYETSNDTKPFQQPSRLIVLARRCVARMEKCMEAIEGSASNAIIFKHFDDFEVQFDMLRTNIHVFVQICAGRQP